MCKQAYRVFKSPQIMLRAEPLNRLVETTAAQPQKSLRGATRPDVTVIAEIKSFHLIPITFTEMSPEYVGLMYRTREGIGCGDN